MTKANVVFWAAVAHAATWAFALFFLIVINPTLGLNSPEALDNGFLVLSIFNRDRVIVLYPGMDVLLGTSLILFAAFFAPSRNREVNRLQEGVNNFAYIAGAFMILGTFYRLVPFLYLADLMKVNAAKAVDDYSLINILTYGNSRAVNFFLSLWILFTHTLGYFDRTQSRRLCVVGIALGLFGVFSFAFPPIAMLAVVLFVSYRLVSYGWQQRRLHLAHHGPHPHGRAA